MTLFPDRRVASACRCEHVRTDVRGRCRVCHGVPEVRIESDLPHQATWWPFTDEENER